MLRFYKNASIKRKLILIAILTAAVVLILNSVILIGNEVLSFKRALIESLNVQAEMIGNNSAVALTFKNRKDADDILGALKAASNIRHAVLYIQDGTVFAQYLRSGEGVLHAPQKTGPAGYTFTMVNVSLFKPIVFNNEVIGTIYIDSDLRAFHERLFVYVLTALAVSIIALAVAFVILVRLQATITNPIMELVELTKIVSQGKDYTARSSVESRDEIGSLAHGFNEMLSEIQKRDAELEIHRKYLEQQVVNRTAELAAVNENLQVELAERLRTEKELIAAKHAAEQASRMKSEFLANMSHEIRTPMNGVIGMTTLALETELTADQRDYMQAVQRSAYSLLSIINDILDFSKMEAGKLTIDKIDFNLRNTVETVVETVAPIASEKGLVLACLVNPEVPMLVNGDPGRIRQILLNLANNAIKFTHQGEVVIRAELGKLNSEDSSVVSVLFSVTDTGIGILEEKKKAIFDEFVQADGSTTRVYGGTGLGLSISKKLTELMGGDIGVESEFGKGSRFWFKVNFEKPVNADVEQEKPVVPTNIKNMKVLIVDDNQTNLTIFEKMVTGFGFRAEMTRSGSDAIEILKKAAAEGNPFGLVLLDMMMPGMNGEHTIIIIRNTHEIWNTPIIMLTSMGSRADGEKLKKIGCNGYLTKPIKQSILLDSILLNIQQDAQKEDRAKPKPLMMPERKMGKGRVLLVEDNAVNCKLASIMLRKAGYEVDIAENGLLGLDAFSKADHDIILMDCQMPEMDGYATTKIIREREGDKHNIIVAMTAHAMTGDREKCIEAGMDDYITKPINPKQMVDVIEKWLNNGKEENEA